MVAVIVSLCYHFTTIFGHFCCHSVTASAFELEAISDFIKLKKGSPKLSFSSNVFLEERLQ